MAVETVPNIAPGGETRREEPGTGSADHEVAGFSAALDDSPGAKPARNDSAARAARGCLAHSGQEATSSAGPPDNHAPAVRTEPKRTHVQVVADIGSVVITPAWPAAKVVSAVGETAPGTMPSPEVVAPPKPSTGLDSRPIGWLSTSIRTSHGDLPSDAPATKFAAELGGPGVPMARKVWAQTACLWHPSMLCHQPLYFEEVNLERYGYSTPLSDLTQPFVSAGRFFATVPVLPYLTTAEPVWQTNSTLGEYRPGSCVPNQIQWPPLDVKAAAVEATAVTGAALLIP
jgi:hypothetical protein